MLRDPSMRRLGLRARGLTAALLFGVVYGHAQSRIADPFAGYHDALSTAADRALAGPAQPVVPAPRTDFAASTVSIEAPNPKTTRPAAMNRVEQLRPIIEPILREEEVPTELAAIVLVESGGRPTALSPKGARGLWQFMPDTARRYGLIVTPQRDERLDVGRSTRAAARYLRDLHRQFGDWQLAFAAYNAGGDLVQRAIERNHSSDFMLLSSRGSLPLETSRYVPAVLAAMQQFGNSNGSLVPLPNPRVTWVLYAGTGRATDETEFLRETKGELK